MSSVRRKQNNPTKSASDLKKRSKAGKSSKAALAGEPEEPSLARSRPQRKIIPKRPLSPDVELSSRRKKRRKKKATQSQSKSKSINLVATHAVHIKPDELKPPKLSKQHKASLKKKKKRKKKTFVFPVLAADRVIKEPKPEPPGRPDPTVPGPSKKRAKPVARNVLDVDLLRMLPAADLVKRFAKHTSFKVPTKDSAAFLKQHVYTCRMLPHYCTEKFYGNDLDTRRQITKHLLRHVGELFTVTNRGINLLGPASTKPKPEKTKKKDKKNQEDGNSTMYILPSAPRPMRVTLPKNVSSRMKRSSYTVIRSAEGKEKGINEVVLLPKGRLISILPPNVPNKKSSKKRSKKVKNIDQSLRADAGMASGDANVCEVFTIKSKAETEEDGDAVQESVPGLSIESLAEAVEALVNKESYALNIQAAEALAKEIKQEKDEAATQSREGELPSTAPKHQSEKDSVVQHAPVSVSVSVSSPGSSSLSTSSSTKSSPGTSSTRVKTFFKVKKEGGKKKKSVSVPTPHLSSAVDTPHPDHNYALGPGIRHPDGSAPVHLDSEGRPIDPPPKTDESEPERLSVDPLVDSMNDQLNRLIADIETPASQARVSNENEEPVVVEGANVTVENEEVPPAKKPRKYKMKPKPPPDTAENEEIKKTAQLLLDSLSGRRKGPFQCQICQKELTAASTLRAHYRSHAGIKPYQCDICQATFTRLHSLKYHTMIHNKEARFLCSYCQRQFRHSSHYREHLRRHTGEEPFGCSDCSARFKTRNTFKRHMRSKHGKVVAEDGKINLATNMFQV